MRIAIGSDHRGFRHKEAVAAAFKAAGHEMVDCGCPSEESADYTDAALAVAGLVSRGEAGAGVLICGSGIGMSIAANKVRGVRASLCFTPDQAATTRRHNDSNVLCLSGDAVAPEDAVTLARVWLDADFEGGRHARRVDKITAYENEHLTGE
jgi:ribose 5-phosphate isomerase B